MQKGFFSTIFTVFLIILLIATISINHLIEKESNKENNFFLENEKAKLIRFEIEHNVDKTIEQAMKTELLKQNHETEKIKLIVAAKLIELFEKEKEFNSANRLDFFIGKIQSKDYSIEPFKTSELSQFSAMELFSIQLNPEKPIIQAVFRQHGGLLKNKTIFGKIVSQNSIHYFAVPIDYETSIRVIMN